MNAEDTLTQPITVNTDSARKDVFTILRATSIYSMFFVGGMSTIQVISLFTPAVEL
jgi:hypothetical protein